MTFDTFSITISCRRSITRSSCSYHRSFHVRATYEVLPLWNAMRARGGDASSRPLRPADHCYYHQFTTLLSLWVRQRGGLNTVKPNPNQKINKNKNRNMEKYFSVKPLWRCCSSSLPDFSFFSFFFFFFFFSPSLFLFLFILPKTEGTLAHGTFRVRFRCHVPIHHHMSEDCVYLVHLDASRLLL